MGRVTDRVPLWVTPQVVYERFVDHTRSVTRTRLIIQESGVPQQSVKTLCVLRRVGV